MKTFIKSVYEAALAHPLIAIGIVLVIAYVSYFTIPSAIFEYKSEKHAEEMETRRTEVEAIKLDAKADAAIGQTEAGNAAKSEGEFRATRETISTRKNHVKKLETDAADVGARPIRDADLQSDLDLCARANSLGVRCDLP